MSSRNLRLASQASLYCVCLYSNSCAHVHETSVFAVSRERAFQLVAASQVIHVNSQPIFFVQGHSQKFLGSCVPTRPSSSAGTRGEKLDTKDFAERHANVK